jgi:LPS export ABC transporter protein LptC
LSACAEKELPVRENTVQTLEDFSMMQSISGRKAWTLSAPKAHLMSAGAALLSRPRIELFRDGRVTSTAEGDEAIVQEGSQDFMLRGGVKIYSPSEKATLKTDRLRYVARTARFKTDSDVTIVQPGAVLRGKGLDADSSLSEIRIRQMETKLEK